MKIVGAALLIDMVSGIDTEELLLLLFVLMTFCLLVPGFRAAQGAWG
jgi:hypothetical protein